MAKGLLVRLIAKVAPARVSYRRARLNTRPAPAGEFLPLTDQNDIAKYFDRFIFALSDAEKKAKGIPPKNAFRTRISDWLFQAQGKKFCNYVMTNKTPQVYALKSKSGEIHGGFTCNLNDEGNLLVSSMFLTPAVAKKRSLINQMINIVKQNAEKNNCEEITCTVMNSKLFQKLGFKEGYSAYGAVDMSCKTRDFARNWFGGNA